MTNTWASSIQQSLISMGFTINKRDCDGHWQVLLGDEMVSHSRSKGDLLRQMSNELGVD